MTSPPLPRGLQAVHLAEGFEVEFTIAALTGSDAAAVKDEGLRREPERISGTPTDVVHPGGLPDHIADAAGAARTWTAFSPAPSFALVALLGIGEGTRSVPPLGRPCGARACPGVAGISHSVAVAFEGRFVRAYVAGEIAGVQAGMHTADFQDGREHTVRVRVRRTEGRRSQIMVWADGNTEPVLSEELGDQAAALLSAHGADSRLAFTAGTGWSSSRPLVLGALRADVVRPSVEHVEVTPSMEMGTVGRAGQPCFFTLRARTGCGLHATTWFRDVRVFVQAIAHSADGKTTPRGDKEPVSPAPPDRREPGPGEQPFRWVPEMAGAHRVTVASAAGDAVHVGDVLVLA